MHYILYYNKYDAFYAQLRIELISCLSNKTSLICLKRDKTTTLGRQTQTTTIF